MNTLKCHECVESGQKSEVYPGSGSVTCLGWQPYYDKDGVYHSHDPNWHSIRYTCSQGHSWGESRRNPCPSEDCDWGKDNVKLQESDPVEGQFADDTA